MKMLLTPHFIPSIQRLLTARNIREDDIRVKALAHTLLHELRSAKNIQDFIGGVYDELIGEDVLKIGQLKLDNAYIELMKNSDEPVIPAGEKDHDDDDLFKPGELLISQKFGRGGYFERPRDLLEQIVPKLKNYAPAAEAVYNNVTKCIDFNGSGQYKIRAQAPLAYMLGLKPGEWWNLSPRLATYPCDLKRGIYNIFIYTDIIQY
ncbi:hypothetical protein PAMA_005546 [Pampus argenteus]